MKREILVIREADGGEINSDDLESVNNRVPRPNDVFNYIDKDIYIQFHLLLVGV